MSHRENKPNMIEEVFAGETSLARAAGVFHIRLGSIIETNGFALAPYDPNGKESSTNRIEQLNEDDSRNKSRRTRRGKIFFLLPSINSLINLIDLNRQK